MTGDFKRIEEAYERMQGRTFENVMEIGIFLLAAYYSI